MRDEFFGGLDFGTSGARISIINLKKEALKIPILGVILVKSF